MMTFEELLSLVASGNPPQIRTDSRVVRDGDIFVAVKGTVYDGHDFIDRAVANGAGYIVCERDTQHKAVIVEDSAEAAAILAQAAAGNPASRLTNLAVTGTNGKTTVAFLVRSCIRQADEKCGLIGTVIYDACSGCDREAALTTPDCLTIAAGQQEMVKNGAKYMVIEASSHALDQNRLAHVNFKAAAFTNITGDHLDYHKTKEEYLAAKTKLFSALSPDAVAVLNRESPEAEHIATITPAKVLWYGVDENADLIAHIESMDVNGAVFTLEFDGKLAAVRSPLLGRYNISNHLAAAGLCLAAGFDLETIAAGLSALQVVPGRLEKINWGGPFSVLIDYAHTDDALKNVLETLKLLCKGKLRVVFGCGGDRDKTKRPRMAKVAEQLADVVYVTSDNPRTENPEAIISDIVAGFERSPVSDASCVMLRAKDNHDTRYAIRNTKIIEPDRAKAIESAIKDACKDDIVLIAGKGHETYQIIGKNKIHFSDKEIAAQCLIKLPVGTLLLNR
jgi:UDP-N-acetylmuramoyl-L-alanyl-D-glutamate--2,6-diaminopimelate ligase